MDTLTFSIETLWDEIPDENETLIITIFYPDGCGEEQSSSATIDFVDPYELETETDDVDVICPAEQTQVTAEGSNGIAPYDYDWGEFGMAQTTAVPVPEDEQYYVVGVTDQCGFEIALDSVLVTNSIPPPLQAAIDFFPTPTCPNETVDLDGIVADGNPPYNFIWEDSQANGYPNQPSISVSNINPVLLAFSDTLGVTLTVVDSCGTTLEDGVLIEYPDFDSLGVTFGPLTENCPLDPVELDANAEGGAGDLEYVWNVLEGESEFAPGSTASDQTTFVIPSNGDNTYEVVVTDRCFRSGEDMLIAVDGNDQIRTGLATYIDSVPIIRLDPLPDVITPNGDGRNDFFVIEGVDSFDNARLEVFDRWGKLVYETGNYKAAQPGVRPSDGVFDAEGYEDGTFFYVINIDSGECTKSGYLQVLRAND
ncbi:MAG: gliding motility-associated C-terminal domain-containing protein [Flavobacteriales bacterium]|nr:gliding motility-associated C-terminal domain-containing protein [Flavobacteriales bacterium]